MPAFFPRTSVQWTVEEPHAARWLSIWLVPMALMSGTLVRGVRALMLGHLSASWWGVSLYYGLTGIIFFAALTAHVANFPVGRWLWRVPAFTLVNCVAESAVSLALIQIGKEPLGSTMASMHDWWPMAESGFWNRLLAAAVYSALLAGAVQFVRYVVIPKGERETMDIEGDRETSEIKAETVERALAK
jgi:hypothetical protein